MTAVSTAQMEIQGITQSLLGSLVCGALEGIVTVGSVAGVEGAVGSVTSGSVTGGKDLHKEHFLPRFEISLAIGESSVIAAGGYSYTLCSYFMIRTGNVLIQFYTEDDQRT